MANAGMRRLAVFLLVIAAGLAAGAAGCAAPRQALPTAEEIVTAGAVPAGADAEALRRGRAIYVTECAGCHRLYMPSEYTPSAWRPIARRMGARVSLGEEEIADLLAYLTAASRGGGAGK